MRKAKVNRPFGIVLIIVSALLIVGFVFVATSNPIRHRPVGVDTPIVCPDCMDQQRPESIKCGDDWNPTTLPGGAAHASCEL